MSLYINEGGDWKLDFEFFNLELTTNIENGVKSNPKSNDFSF